MPGVIGSRGCSTRYATGCHWQFAGNAPPYDDGMYYSVP